MHNLEDLVDRYYKRIFFLFVPNVCNAKCPFCYVKPCFSENAILSNLVLNKTKEFVNSAKKIGFNEFRITGGEPLVYENISELLYIFKNYDISYTLITNGMNIKNHIELFNSNKPKKITISYHSKLNHNNIFGVEYNTEMLDESIRELCKRKINIAITIIVFEGNRKEILSHVLFLKSLGVKSFKIIYPNDKKIKMSLRNEFVKIIKSLETISGIEIRHSELNSPVCNMISRGFLSYLLDRNNIYDCCYAMSNEHFIGKINSVDSLEAIIWKFYNTAQMLNTFPCESYVDFCPIALNN